MGWDLENRSQVVRIDVGKELTGKGIPLSLASYTADGLPILIVQLKSGLIVEYAVERDGAVVQLQCKSQHKCGSETFFRISCPSSHDGSLLMLVPSLEQPSKLDLVDLSGWRVVVGGIRPDGVDPGMCLCARMLKDGDSLIVVAGYDNGTVSLYKCDGAAFSLYLTLQLFPQSVLDLNLTKDKDSLKVVACGAGNELKMATIVSLDDYTVISQPVSDHGIGSIDVDGDGLVIASGGWDARLRFFSSKSLTSLGVQTLHQDSVNVVRFLRFPRGLQGCQRPGQRFDQLLVSGSKDSSIILWDVQITS